MVSRRIPKNRFPLRRTFRSLKWPAWNASRRLNELTDFCAFRPIKKRRDPIRPRMRNSAGRCQTFSEGGRHPMSPLSAVRASPGGRPLSRKSDLSRFR